MNNFTGGVIFGLLIFYFIACMIVYWKSVVLIFNFGNALAQSIVFSIFGSMILMIATMYLWPIAMVLVLVIGIVLAVKATSGGGKAVAIVFAIILSIVIAVAGNMFKKSVKTSSNTEIQTYTACLQGESDNNEKYIFDYRI